MMKNEAALPVHVVAVIVGLKRRRHEDLTLVLATLREHGWSAEALAEPLRLTSNYTQSLVRHGRSRLVGRSTDWLTKRLRAVGLAEVPTNKVGHGRGSNVRFTSKMGYSRSKVVSPYAFLDRQQVETVRAMYRVATRNPNDRMPWLRFLTEVDRLQRELKVPGPCFDVIIGRPSGWCGRLSVKMGQLLGPDTNK